MTRDGDEQDQLLSQAKIIKKKTKKPGLTPSELGEDELPLRAFKRLLYAALPLGLTLRFLLSFASSNELCATTKKQKATADLL